VRVAVLLLIPVCIALSVGVPGSSLLAGPETFTVGPYRFQVPFAYRGGAPANPTMEIMFRLYESERPRPDFCDAFKGRMHVVDEAGRKYALVLQPMKRGALSEAVPWEGYMGIARLSARGRRPATPVPARASHFRLVIEDPTAPRDESDRPLVVRLH
jgi:hypothetical protein